MLSVSPEIERAHLVSVLGYGKRLGMGKNGEVLRDTLNNERLLTPFHRKKIQNPRLRRKKEWPKLFRKWGAKHLEELLKAPETIIFDKQEGAFLLGMWFSGELVVCVIGADSSKLCAVYPLEKIHSILVGEKERYIVVY